MEGEIKDARYPAATWAKMQYARTLSDGTTVDIQYWRLLTTGEAHGFKFE